MKKLFPIVIVVALVGCTSSVTEITRLRTVLTDDQVIVLNDVRGDTALVVQLSLIHISEPTRPY